MYESKISALWEVTEELVRLQKILDDVNTLTPGDASDALCNAETRAKEAEMWVREATIQLASKIPVDKETT